jgi:hypothetical protein
VPGKVGFVGTCPCLAVIDQASDHRPRRTEESQETPPFGTPCSWSSPRWMACQAPPGVWQSSGRFLAIGVGVLHTLGSKMLTKWPQSTRLETRTKESNMYASIAGGKNPGCVVKANAGGNTFFFSSKKSRVHHRPIWIIYMIDLSVSIPVGTRKMVNYA